MNKDRSRLTRRFRSCWTVSRSIFVLLVALLAWPASAYELSPGNTNEVLAGPPGPQPGDEAPYEITIGQARQALWYRGAYDILTEELSMVGSDYEALRVANSDQAEIIRDQNAELDQLRISRDLWRGVALVEAGGIVAILLGVVIAALAK